MNSIYNDDIAIRNTIKGNTMSNKNNNKQGLAALSTAIIADSVREIANNADITGEERDMIIEAVHRLDRVDPANEMVSDWRNAALSATAERDRLRVEIANRAAEIEILNHRINRLERCVIQNALNTSRLAQRDEEESDDNIIFHAGRVVQNQIDHERHNDETGYENGEL